MLHRDIKPQNLIVAARKHAPPRVEDADASSVSQLGRAILIDFGISRALRTHHVDHAVPATASVVLRIDDSVVAGTPAFMAPEQADGREHTKRSDIYQLGATLYTLLARRSPYVATASNVPAVFDVIKQVLTTPPPPLREIAPHLPLRLSKIIEKAMERDPAKRYASAALLASDLEAFRRDRAGSIDGILTRPLPFAWRNKIALLVVAAFIALIGIAGEVFSLERAENERARDLSKMNKEQLMDEAAAATREAEKNKNKAAAATSARNEAEAKRNEAEMKAKRAEDRKAKAEEEKR